MENKKLKVLSLFDGISVARLALNSLGIDVDYYASEIDEYAISISKKNWNDITRLGSVTEIKDVTDIDLLIGGSPCQNLSVAKRDREGLAGEQSKLFWEFVRIYKESNPKYFLLENVFSMAQADKDIITEQFGVEPVMVDANNFSAQDRKRLFWTNIPLNEIVQKNINIKDILNLQATRTWLKKDYVHTKTGVKWDTSGKGYGSVQDRARYSTGKSYTVPASRTVTKLNFIYEGKIGVMLWEEAERLQSLPAGYTDLGDENRSEKRGRAIGNAFNAKVIEYLLQNLKVLDKTK